MEGQEKRQYGLTKPIKDDYPTEEEIALDSQLLQTLKEWNNFETPEGTAIRIKVLNHFQKVVEEFVRRVCKAKKLPQVIIENAGGKIYTFGSYALGVYNPGSDIDTMIMAPKHVSMDDFFEYFPPTFREMSAADDIGEFIPVQEAFVPIIKIKYCGISIDLLFVSLPSMSHIPRDLESTGFDLLRGLGDSAIRSINGPRVCQELIASVPQVKTFRHATRAIKLWSTQRAVYGAQYGYPGGVAWAIMVARICQLYPNAIGASIVAKFFNLLMQWNWPRPIMLKHVEDSPLSLKVWNPSQSHIDRAHLMPVITPAYPSMCSTHTVGKSTLSIMVSEFKRANDIAIDIQDKKKKWDDLFQRHTFFTKDYKFYLSVVGTSLTKDARDRLSGLVASKVRILVKGIEEGDGAVDIARLFPEKFDRIHRCATEEQIQLVKQGSVEFQINKDEVPTDDTQTLNGDAPKIIYTTTFYIGLEVPTDEKLKLDISYPVDDFRRLVESNPDWKEEEMSVRVVYTRNYALPDDVFQPDETKPLKPVKEKKKKRKANGAKRQFAETGLENSREQPATKKHHREPNGRPTPTPA